VDEDKAGEMLTILALGSAESGFKELVVASLERSRDAKASKKQGYINLINDMIAEAEKDIKELGADEVPHAVSSIIVLKELLRQAS